jgi:hypothetical protein
MIRGVDETERSVGSLSGVAAPPTARRSQFVQDDAAPIS